MLKRKIARRSAHFLGRFAAPVNVFKLTGVLPYSEASAKPRILREHDEPPAFAEMPPLGPGDGRAWVTSTSDRSTLPHVALLPHGIALSQGAVLDRKGGFLKGESHDYERAIHRTLPRRDFVPAPHVLFPRIRKLRSAVVTLTASNQSFYFHWLLDILPRLHLAEQAGYGQGPFFVETERPFQRETLRLLGVKEESLINSHHTQAVSAENLVVPCHRIMPGHAFPQWPIDFLRARILPGASAARRPPATRLYVSRRQAGHRRVTNEPEIIRFLADFGFHVVELEKLAFADQVALFRDARLVISPHGSGLANLVFCAPGTKAIELFPSANIDLYYRLARCLEIDYFYVRSPGESSGSMGPADYPIRLADLKVALNAAFSGERDGVADFAPPM